jgi:DNA polymerase III sliding clamp (beta) subunit (PCNA family)
MRLHCPVSELHVAVRSLGDVWRDHHADGDGAVGLTVKAGETELVIRAASQRSYGQNTVTLSQPASEDVDMTLSSSMLMTLFKKLDDAQIHIDSQIMTLREASREYQLNSLDAQVAPRPTDLPEGGMLIDADAVRDVADALILCTSVSDMRTALGGVQIQWDGENLHLIATDSYRLMHATLVRLDTGGPDTDVIVPVRAFEWMTKTAKLLGAGAARVAFDDRWLALRVGNAEYVTAPQAGRFPIWRDVVPRMDGAPRARFDRADLLASLQRLQPFCGHAERVHWQPAGNALMMKAKDSVLGHAHERIAPLEGRVALDETASYTISLLIQILQKIHSDEVTLAWPLGHARALLVHGGGHIEYLQMPLHTGEI